MNKPVGMQKIKTKEEFLGYLDQLQVSPVEVARLLSVTPRTIHRWLEYPRAIPLAAKHAFKAWIYLKKNNIPWRPGYVPLGIIGDLEKCEVLDFSTKFKLESKQ